MKYRQVGDCFTLTAFGAGASQKALASPQNQGRFRNDSWTGISDPGYSFLGLGFAEPQPNLRLLRWLGFQLRWIAPPQSPHPVSAFGIGGRCKTQWDSEFTTFQTCYNEIYSSRSILTGWSVEDLSCSTRVIRLFSGRGWWTQEILHLLQD